MQKRRKAAKKHKMKLIYTMRFTGAILIARYLNTHIRQQQKNFHCEMIRFRVWLWLWRAARERRKSLLIDGIIRN
jgi:hypothetical protein